MGRAPKGMPSSRANCIIGAMAICLAVVLNGCSGSSNGASGDERSHLGALVTVYKIYMTKSGQKPPPDEAAFRKFIAEMDEDKQTKYGADDLEAFFTSTRDGQPYVVLYGDAAKNSPSEIFVYEKEGANGTRWFGQLLGSVGELDDAAFQKMLSGSADSN